MMNLSNKAFCLIQALNHDGSPKTGELYDERVGCITKKLKQVYSDNNDHYMMLITFILDGQNRIINYRLRTSIVDRLVETENGFDLHTQNTIYVFKEVMMPTFPHPEEANLIELYLNDEDYQFCCGYYYDKNKLPHELHERVHLGMFQDSVLIQLDENNLTVCRYFPGENSVEFYNTIFQQQVYQIPMLIHNVGKNTLKVIYGVNTWVILSGDKQRIVLNPQQMNNNC